MDFRQKANEPVASIHVFLNGWTNNDKSRKETLSNFDFKLTEKKPGITILFYRTRRVPGRTKKAKQSILTDSNLI